MSCMSSRSSRATSSKSKSSDYVHAWDIVVHYYKLKRGHEFNSAPARKLSQSFGLDLAGSASSNRQSLLAAVGQVIASHGKYKRSADAHFKAFVCEGLK